MAKEAKFPPLLVVSGGQTLLRLRFLRGLVAAQKEAGWLIETVDGENSVAMRDVLQGGGLFTTKSTLAVVTKPNKAKLEVLIRHSEAKSYTTTLVLHIEGEPDGRTKFGRFIKKIGKVHKAFSKPKEWDAPKVAAKFVLSEVNLQGMTMENNLIHALIDRSGSDLGVLAFEVDKMVLLAQATGTTKIGSVQVKGAMAPIAEASIAPIVDALVRRDRKRLSKALTQLRKTSKYDPTMRICGFLGSSVTKWVQAAHLDHMPPKAAAAELKINPWYFENKILPPAQRWGKEGTIRLASALAASERAVLRGAVSPWTVLMARLLAAC